MELCARQLLLPLLGGVSAVVLAQTTALDLSFDPDELSPAVTIQEHENRVVEEYRVNGNLYMIKVNPTAGPSYYLVDPAGSGDFEWRRDTPNAELNVPQWALGRW